MGIIYSLVYWISPQFQYQQDVAKIQAVLTKLRLEREKYTKIIRRQHNCIDECNAEILRLSQHKQVKTFTEMQRIDIKAEVQRKRQLIVIYERYAQIKSNIECQIDMLEQQSTALSTVSALEETANIHRSIGLNIERVEELLNTLQEQQFQVAEVQNLFGSATDVDDNPFTLEYLEAELASLEHDTGAVVASEFPSVPQSTAAAAGDTTRQLETELLG